MRQRHVCYYLESVCASVIYDSVIYASVIRASIIYTSVIGATVGVFYNQCVPVSACASAVWVSVVRASIICTSIVDATVGVFYNPCVLLSMYSIIGVYQYRRVPTSACASVTCANIDIYHRRVF